MRNLPSVENPSTGRDKILGDAGAGLIHESAHKHVSGEAIYTDDQPAPEGVLHAYVGLSTVAHAKIKKLDLTKVAAAPGVVSVLTLADVPGHVDIGAVAPGDPVLADGKVEFWGEPLFAVAATSYNLARKAARLASVEYEELEADLTIEQGLQKKSFVRPGHSQKRGDVEKALARSGNVLSGEMNIGGQEHMYLEGQASLAIPVEDGGILLYTSSQNPSEAQKLVAEVLNIPMSRVTVDVRRMGGGFGGKETHGNQWACLAALLARKTGRPVRIRLARADDMATTGKRHHFHVRYRVGFDDKGLIEALDMELSGGCGKSPDLSDAIVDRAMFHADNAYFLPEVHIVGHRVKTHTVSNTAFRGFGGPQGMVAIENVVDNIARAVGRDPLDVRKANFYTDEGERNTTHYGQKIEQHIIPSLVERLEGTSDYRRRRQDIRTFNNGSPVLKKGIALTPVKFGISFTAQHLNQAGALIHIYTDGSIALNHGGTEMGQGLYTKVAQVVAHEFQVDVDRVLCTSTRTDKVPNTSPTAASSGSDLNGMAARDAACKIRSRLLAFAAEHFDVPLEEVRLHNSCLHAGGQVMGFTEFVQLAYMNRISLSATGFYRTPRIFYDRDKARGRPFFYFANGAAVSEVLVDTLLSLIHI
ncbi:MAG: xanthine dehydrogenase molybdopterin binding subunit, partial [Proteobacteria bacterium]|nr:xanthine dehydrogenase molybdopterin binding subunit [Pseudomonadota bacterium]